MNTKHTPGPWTVTAEFSNHYFGEIRIIDLFFDTVCIMPDNWSIWNSEKNEEAAKEARKTAETNAQLIAAAPDMLETFIMLDNYFKGTNLENGFIHNHLKAAILKATGGAQ
jgi:hypothetical protein